jgi:hypothetical protein
MRCERTAESLPDRLAKLSGRHQGEQSKASVIDEAGLGVTGGPEL